MRSVLLLAAFDSQLKWCARLRDEFAARGFSWQVLVPEVRSSLSAEQMLAAGFSGVERVSWLQALEAVASADVVVSALSGPTNDALLADLGRCLVPNEPGPVVVTGWVGVIIENATGGYLNRCASDVIAVNSRSDLRHFTQVGDRLGIPTDNLLLTGLPILSSTPQPLREDPIRRVLFADQPTVPRDPEQRLFLYRRLLAYATAHPDREVVLKPRHRPGEDTFHRMRHHPESLLAGVESPANFAFDYTPVAEQIQNTDLLLTVSSTACLEAVEQGCRVGLVVDLGVHEKLGNHVFLDSGLLRTFDQISDDDLGVPDPVWLDDNFFPRSGTAAQLMTDRVEELLATGERPSHAVRNAPYYTSTAAVHAVLAGARRLSARSRTGWRGQLASLSHAVLPPVLVRPVRRLANQAGVLW